MDKTKRIWAMILVVVIVLGMTPLVSVAETGKDLSDIHEGAISLSSVESVKGVIPRTKVDVTLDAKDDEDFWEGAYVEELNETTAVIKETMLDDIPTEDLPSLTIKMVYYSEFPDDEDPDNMMYIFDENGGIIVYM